MPYQCSASARAREQAERLMELLNNLHTLHPDVLEAHGVTPSSYLNESVFRHALESIRGTFIASAQAPREQSVEQVLIGMRQRGMIRDFEFLGRNPESRVDFRVHLHGDYTAAIEVKGGEGNSWNISERPDWANEYIAWGHLDGSLNDPRHGVHAIIITRVVQDFIQREKKFDAILFKDRLCGTAARPCPKYENQMPGNNLVAPDLFLLPREIPAANAPSGSTHDHTTLRFPYLVLDYFGVPIELRGTHTFEVRVSRNVKRRRQNYGVDVIHQGRRVDGN